MRKLAFWMATGSGKTILMHFHYRQFLHYCQDTLDNILLVTPDEGLSQQHIENMEAAGIPCARFSLEDSGFEAVKKNAVRVIEITKLVEEKKGSGVSVPVEAFEGNNLIFVDEGHRGASSEAGKWIGYRDKLAETGFTFEYSATFGQAMTTARDDDMTAEYGKAILFDYSYKYFYGDGFGKDFEVLNLRQETTEEQTKMLLLANLLAFHQQKRAFQTKSDGDAALSPGRPALGVRRQHGQQIQGQQAGQGIRCFDGGEIPGRFPAQPARLGATGHQKDSGGQERH